MQPACIIRSRLLSAVEFQLSQPVKSQTSQRRLDHFFTPSRIVPQQFMKNPSSRKSHCRLVRHPPFPGRTDRPPKTFVSCLWRKKWA